MARDGKRLSLGQNTSVNLAGRGVSMVLSLFISAYVVHRLGLRTFGFWAVVSAASQYAQLLDFGVGPALSRFIAHFDERSSTTQCSVGLRRACGARSRSLQLSRSFATAFAFGLPHSITASWPEGWQLAVVCNGAALGLASIGSIFQAFPNAMGRWDLSNLAQLAGQVTYSAFTVVALGTAEDPGRARRGHVGGCTCHLRRRIHVIAAPLADQIFDSSCDKGRSERAVALRHQHPAG